MTISAQTKIAAILKAVPESLDVMVSISPRFEKLRNPVLRKLMAGRTSLAMAAKVGGCRVEDFFAKLEPLGFKRAAVDGAAALPATEPLPGFLRNPEPGTVVVLDVRPLLEEGHDPLQQILQAVSSLGHGQALQIINSFEPVPLIQLLGKRGFASYTEVLQPDRVHTWFYREKPAEPQPAASSPADHQTGFEEVLQRFAGKLEERDVRHLEMPQPMLTILAALDQLQPGQALFVHHKRIPVFLLPELTERKLHYRIREAAGGEVQLLIYPN